jgi:UDP-N-acetylglucosamine--N-acetylmuramyl-(pentapeptide) pyrophosphoryl-undecaprenol N-acetylglucosamine transferase
VLVVGGSQGARILNQTVPKALAELPVAERPEVWHQAGRGLDDGAMWPSAYALTYDLTPADEKRIAELVTKAAG